MQTIGKINAVDGAFTLTVAMPQRRGSDAADVAVYDHLYEKGLHGRAMVTFGSGMASR